jgi:hypothetical protein
MNEPDSSQERIAEQAKKMVSARPAQASRRLNRHSAARNRWVSPTHREGRIPASTTGRVADAGANVERLPVKSTNRDHKSI